MRNKPSYAVSSVDHALHLAQLLQQEGPLRVTEAAERIGVSASTAHRLLAMLVYRDFAEQGPDRRYRAGPVLRPAVVTASPVATLRRVSLPHLHTLVERVQESANVMVRVGTEVRFIATVECDQVLRVGDREGRALPAHRTSGGKALLAALPDGALEDLYAADEDVDVPRLAHELALVRERGFALNDGLSEVGVTALGTVLRDTDGQPVGALSVGMPTARFDRDKLHGWLREISATTRSIERDLRLTGDEAPGPDSPAG